MEQNGTIQAATQEVQTADAEAARQNIAETFKTWREAKIGKAIMAGQTPLGHILVAADENDHFHKKTVVAMFNDGTVAILESQTTARTVDFDQFISDLKEWSFPEEKTIEDIKRDLKNGDQYSKVMSTIMSGPEANDITIDNALTLVLTVANKELEKRSTEQQDEQAIKLSKKMDQFNPRKQTRISVPPAPSSPGPTPQPGPSI